MSLTLTSIKHDIIPYVLCNNTKITLIKMASFSSSLLVFFLASLILIPQGFGSQPHHHPKHPPSTQGVHPTHPTHPKHPPSTQGVHPTHPTHPTTLPKPTYPASFPKKSPHHPPKEDNTHF